MERRAGREEGLSNMGSPFHQEEKCAGSGGIGSSKALE